MWLSDKVVVAKFPAEAIDCDYRINVSDLYRPEIDKLFKVNFWFPLGEAFGLSLSSLYGALRVLYEAEKADKMVLLHCHAGRNRSRVVYDSYHFLKTQEHTKDSKLLLNVDDGQLPGVYKMEEFLGACRNIFEEDPENLRPLDSIKFDVLTRGSGF